MNQIIRRCKVCGSSENNEVLTPCRICRKPLCSECIGSITVKLRMRNPGTDQPQIICSDCVHQWELKMLNKQTVEQLPLLINYTWSTDYLEQMYKICMEQACTLKELNELMQRHAEKMIDQIDTDIKNQFLEVYQRTQTDDLPPPQSGIGSSPSSADLTAIGNFCLPVTFLK